MDGYAALLAIAFEYHGAQHYEETWLHDAEEFRRQQERDALKRRLCHEHGVRLIVVPEFRSFGKLSGCVDQIEASVLFAGLTIPRRWKRPADLAELLTEAPPKLRGPRMPKARAAGALSPAPGQPASGAPPS